MSASRQYVSIASWKLERRPRPHVGDYGVFAAAPIAKEEFLVAWGGCFMTRAGINVLDAEKRSLSLQIEDDLFLFSDQPAPADFVNHSCEPNAGLAGQIVLVALRAIDSGEEICYDYAMSDGSDYDEFLCSCCSPLCRRNITGNDWQIPALWQKYQGYFSPYIQRRINRLCCSPNLVETAMESGSS